LVNGALASDGFRVAERQRKINSGGTKVKKVRSNKGHYARGNYSQGKIGYCDVCGWVIERATEANDRTMTDGVCDTCGSDVYIESIIDKPVIGKPVTGKEG